MVPGIEKKVKGEDQQKVVSVLRRACFFTGIFFLLLLGSWASSGAVVDRVVAVVNQEIITLSEVEKWKAPLLSEVRAEDRLEKQEQTQEVLRKILDRLVEEKLIDQEVKKMGLKVSAKEMEATLEEIRRKNQMTQEDFERALAREGLTLETLKKQIEKQILRSRLFGMTVKLETKAGEKELREFYQLNAARYRGTESYRPSHILFHVPKDTLPEGVQAIQKKCQKVLDQIRKGADFGEMALLYSEDASSKDKGDLGFFKKGELLPAFEREAFRLKVGEVGSCVRTEFGFHIIKMVDRKGVDPPPFDEVREKVLADYSERELEKALKQFIATLREKSVIEIKL